MSARLTREDRWSYRSGMRLGIRLTYEHARFRRLRTALACLGLYVPGTRSFRILYGRRAPASPGARRTP